MEFIEWITSKILSNPSRYLILVDPKGWLQDPMFFDKAVEYDLVLCPLREVSRNDKFNSKSNLNGKIVLITDNFNEADQWKQKLGNCWAIIDVQPSTVFPSLDPSVTSFISRDQLKILFPEYGNIKGPTKGEYKTSCILLKALYGISIEDIKSVTDLLTEAFIVHLKLLSIPYEWLDIIKDRLPKTNYENISSVELFIDSDVLLKLISSMIESGELRNIDWIEKIEKIFRPFEDNIFKEKEIINIKNRIENIKWEEKRLLDWLDAIPILSQLEISQENDKNNLLSDLRQKIEDIFIQKLVEEYNQLQQSPWFHNPPMIHKIPDYLNSKFQNDKILLVIVDCLSFSTWTILSNYLKKDGIYAITETSTFAMIPTLTEVSRQSILSGMLPRNFEESIFNTSKEEKHWENYWTSKGFQKHSIQLIKNAENQIERINYASKDDSLRRVSIIFNSVDNLFHTTVSAPTISWGDIILNLKDKWLKNIFVPALNAYFDNGWKIFLTSDHGIHKMHKDVGNPKEGIKIEKKLYRARIYKKEVFSLMSEADGLMWYGKGTLPNDYYIILAPYGCGYGASTGWAHGGAAWNEVIVPFVQLGRIKK